MAMNGFDEIGWCLLVGALALLLVAMFVRRYFRTRGQVNVWMASGVVGALLGIAVPYAGLRLAGYELTVPAVTSPGAKAAESASCAQPGKICPMTGKPLEGDAPGMGTGGEAVKICPMTGKPLEGMAGMGTGGEAVKTCPMTGKPLEGMKGTPAMGRAGGPRPRLDLVTLVQKLDLLTGGIGITLTAEQAAAVNDCLKDVEKSATMSHEGAKAKYDRLMAVLNENQKVRLDLISLPQTLVIGEPGTGCPMAAAAAGPMQGEELNPFQQDAQGEAVKSLRERLSSKAAAPKALAPKGLRQPTR
jgi:hypothetical protein